jgi:hypothetical protein
MGTKVSQRAATLAPPGRPERSGERMLAEAPSRSDGGADFEHEVLVGGPGFDPWASRSRTEVEP